MLTGKPIILFGAGILGRRAFNFFGADKVFCFIDNNKAGQIFLDKQIISFDEFLAIKNNYDIVISTTTDTINSLKEQCENSGIHYSIFNDLVSHEDYKSNPAIRQFENKHKGNRCFLVGNGPSLTAKDLTKLHEYEEISFGCNAINNIFNKTPWRPIYYLAEDKALFAFQIEMLANIYAIYKFFPRLDCVYAGDVSNLVKRLEQGNGDVFYFQPITINIEAPCFSPDASRALYIGCTVMYTMLQLAVYMGFAEIYLIGVDGDTTTAKNLEEYMSEKRHFYDEDESYLHQSSTYSPISPETSKIRTNLAYLQAEKHTRSQGIRIFNATRGGKLETFERVDFDSLF